MTERTMLLVTGCFRSGTTLVEKLLHQHPALCVASQPLSQLYYYVREQFLQEKRIRQRYPLDHGFLHDPSRINGWIDFLKNFPLQARDLEAVFDRLAAYRHGVWTPEVLLLRGRIAPGVFPLVYRQFLEHLCRILKPAAAIAGSKDVLLEEYAPALVGLGVRVLVVVRDPRDLAVSAYLGTHERPMGENRPLLFTLRTWRKSVAWILHCQARPEFCWVRYEDLVRRPQQTLDRITHWLQLPPLDPSLLAEGIRAQNGTLWPGNSAFGPQSGIATHPAGQYRRTLPLPMRRYIEAVCFPEMEVTGYHVEEPPRWQVEELAAFREPFAVTHRLFRPGYSYEPEHVRQEHERIKLLVTGRAAALEAMEQTRWFVAPGVAEPLQSAAQRLVQGHSAAEPSSSQPSPCRIRDE